VSAVAAGGHGLFGEPVDRIRVLADDAVSEFVDLASASIGEAGEARPECAEVLVIEAIACAQVVGELAHELVGDSPVAHP